MKAGQQLAGLTAAILNGMDEVLDTHAPDCVLVHGDTTTAMAAGLAAFYRHIPVGHVEAGLRTGDMHHPWPEEMNRRVIDVMADFYYAPTEVSATIYSLRKLRQIKFLSRVTPSSPRCY